MGDFFWVVVDSETHSFILIISRPFIFKCDSPQNGAARKTGHRVWIESISVLVCMPVCL